MKKAFLQLHISILLAGWTGVFGKLMMLSPGLIVFWRIVIAGGCLWLWAWLTKRLEKVTPRDRIAIMGVGALLAVQWTLFYASIKASNVSIGVVAFSSIGFFTALIEPLMNRARISLREMLFSLVTIFGISLIFHFDAQYRLGIALGLVGAAAAALLAVYFKRYRAKYSSVTVMSWQLLGGFAFSCVAIPIYVSLMPPEPFIPTWPDTLYLPIFAIFCTLFMLHPADPVARAYLGLHGQPLLQPRADLLDHPRHGHLRRGPRPRSFLLRRHRTHRTIRGAANQFGRARQEAPEAHRGPKGRRVREGRED